MALQNLSLCPFWCKMSKIRELVIVQIAGPEPFPWRMPWGANNQFSKSSPPYVTSESPNEVRTLCTTSMRWMVLNMEWILACERLRRRSTRAAALWIIISKQPVRSDITIAHASHFDCLSFAVKRLFNAWAIQLCWGGQLYCSTAIQSFWRAACITSYCSARFEWLNFEERLRNDAENEIFFVPVPNLSETASLTITNHEHIEYPIGECQWAAPTNSKS